MCLTPLRGNLQQSSRSTIVSEGAVTQPLRCFLFVFFLIRNRGVQRVRGPCALAEGTVPRDETKKR